MIIMELNDQVENPGFDGRKRSGWQSQKLFPKGGRFALTGGYGGLGARFIGGDGAIEDQRVIASLLAGSKPSEPKNYAEISASFAEPVPPETVLDKLIAAGAIVPADIQKAIAGDHA